MAAPLLAALAAVGVVTLLIAPMMMMKPRNLPIAVANLDKGAETPQGSLNAGEQFTSRVTGSDMDGMVEWITYNSQAEIDEALENNEVYAAFVVPEDFTVTSVGAQQGAGEVNPIVLTVNQGKNPMISSQLATAFNGVTSGDLPIVQQIYRPIPESLGMSAMFLPMLFVLMTFMSSVLTGITTRTTFPLKTEGRWKTLGAQAGIAVLGASLIALTATWIVNSVTGAGLPFGDLTMFLGLAALALITVTIGSVNWLGSPGLAVPALILLLGMITANLAYEVLPGFWQTFVYPWNPLRFMGDGARALAFQGAGWWNTATPGIVVTLLVGLVLLATSALTPLGRKASDPEIAEA